MVLVEEYAKTIIENLPQWNYAGAREKAEVKKQIIAFRKECFKINPNQDSRELLQALAAVIEKCVPDNHISVCDATGQAMCKGGDMPQKINSAFEGQMPLDMAQVVKIPVQADREAWQIGTLADKKTGVVAIPSFGGNVAEQQKMRAQFINTFFEQKNKWKWEHIIFDLRGNTGGDSEMIKELAERMSGQQIKYADKSEKVSTPAGRQKLKEEGFSQEDYRYLPVKGDIFKGSVMVLQDKWNASAAEGAIYMLSQLPHCTTIGENTSGTFQGGETTRLQMSYGSLIIGTTYRERVDKSGQTIKEKEGMKPDVYTPSVQAFSKALELCAKTNTGKNTLLNFWGKQGRG